MEKIIKIETSHYPMRKDLVGIGLAGQDLGGCP